MPHSEFDIKNMLVNMFETTSKHILLEHDQLSSHLCSSSWLGMCSVFAVGSTTNSVSRSMSWSATTPRSPFNSGQNLKTMKCNCTLVNVCEYIQETSPCSLCVLNVYFFRLMQAFYFNIYWGVQLLAFTLTGLQLDARILSGFHWISLADPADKCENAAQCNIACMDVSCVAHLVLQICFQTCTIGG